MSEIEQRCLDSVLNRFDYIQFPGNCDVSDKTIVENLLKTASDSEINGKTEFPDFVCNSGIIEQFEVSAYNESKGSEIHRVCSNLDRKFQKFSKGMTYDTAQPYMVWNDLPSAEYEYLYKSFQKHIAHHTDSLLKYTTLHKGYGTCMFMIDMSWSSNLLYMGIPGDTDISGKEKYMTNLFRYRVSQDKRVLLLLKQYISLIDYWLLIYDYNMRTDCCFECIKSKDIDLILNDIMWDYKCYSRCGLMLRLAIPQRLWIDDIT